MTGQVALPIATTATSVSLQLNGEPVRSTPPDSAGKFVLYPIPVGVYDLVVTAPGRATATITGMPVTATGSTTVNLASAPIDPPASAMRTASGIISTAASPIDAVAGVTKQYMGGPVVLVARGPVNGTTGAFSFSLPASAPVRAAFAAVAPSIAFAVDGAMPTGKYMLVGKAGTTTKTVEFDVSLSTSSRPPGPFPIASSPATAVPEPQLVRDGPLLAVRVDCESPLDRASNLATASAAEISPSIDCDRLGLFDICPGEATAPRASPMGGQVSSKPRGRKPRRTTPSASDAMEFGVARSQR